MKDQFIGMNVKPKVRIKEQHMSIDIFLDKILLELIDHFFFYFIQIKMSILKDLELEDIIYQNG